MPFLHDVLDDIRQAIEALENLSEEALESIVAIF